MKKIHFSLFLTLLLVNIAVKGGVNVFIISFDPVSGNEDFKRMVDLIYLKNKVNVERFTILHFTNRREDDEVWKNKNKQVNYKSSLIDCKFTVCNTISTLITAYKSEKNKFFICNSPLSCDISHWDVESAMLTGSSESKILDKIEEEVAINKSVKKDVSLFFYLAQGRLELDPNVSFLDDSIILKQGESLTLMPMYSNDVSKVEWTPKVDLSCNDCRTPIARPNRSIDYTVVVADSLNCKSNSKTVHVEVAGNCLCGNSSFKPVTDVFGMMSIPKYSNDVDDQIADWQIASNQSGGYVFDFVCKPNCSLKFKVRIEDNAGNKVWEDYFDRSEVDASSRNDYHQLCQECFVFRLNLSNYKKIASNDKNYTVYIYSYDDKNQECAPYRSPRIIFSKCN